MNPHAVTEDFEKAVCDYTNAPYCIAVDNASNALFLALMYDNIKGKTIKIPCRTYMSLPCEIIHAGGNVEFLDVVGDSITGNYPLEGSRVWDSALLFTANMYIPDTYMCCSFTGPYKHLKLGKGGCILTDNLHASLWFKRARYSGRRAMSYHDDNFDMLGWNFYMNPIISALGLLLMQQFYNIDGTKKVMSPLTIPYPDLRKFKIYTDGVSD